MKTAQDTIKTRKKKAIRLPIRFKMAVDTDLMSAVKTDAQQRGISASRWARNAFDAYLNQVSP